MQVFSAPFREVNAGSASRASMATGSDRPEADVGKPTLPANSCHKMLIGVDSPRG